MSAIALIVTLLLAACSQPLRFDPRRTDLQRQYDSCMEKINDPQKCRP